MLQLVDNSLSASPFTRKKFVEHELLKPEAVEFRIYQEKILEVAKHKNTLVVLPTALGKTFIALLLAVDKINQGKIFFLAPTRPLVEQHFKTFLDKTFLEETELIFITGAYQPEKRSIFYRKGQMVFSTPQCLYNDLKRGLISLKNVSLIIFDEAHRAKGNYAYVGVAKYYFSHCFQPLILGLTASPGSDKQKISEICRNLKIETIEARSDEDDDVRAYIQKINVEWKKVKLPKNYIGIRDKLKKIIIDRVKVLQSNGFLTHKKPDNISRKDLVELNEGVQRRLSTGEGGYLYKIKTEATALLSIMHMKQLIETQGPEILKAFIIKSLKRMAYEGSRGHKSIIRDPLFLKVEKDLESCFTVENPKIIELKKIISKQLEANFESRFIVFTQYRDTVKLILRNLSDNFKIKPERFVGQGEREGDHGMKQKEQKEALDKLRNGESNILIATCIAEEGLDIPEVDHVIFYEPVPSEIRYIQRRGRTGRRVSGKVSILIAENTLDEVYYWSSIARTKKMKRIISQLNAKLPKISTRKTNYVKKYLSKPEENTLERFIIKKELWRPETIKTRGLSRALKWLLENLPETSKSINEIVEKVADDTEIDRSVIKTAIWRLIQQGRLYQPEPGKIKRI